MSDMTHVTVIDPGFSTSIQDLGRYGYRNIGMPVAGAMDSYSFKQANWLVGNSFDTACIECTLVGPTLEFRGGCQIAITGADMRPTLDGGVVELNRTNEVKGGSVLKLEGCTLGCRSYIAIAGGFDIEPQMGSVATYTRAKVGGISGVPLSKGNALSYYVNPTAVTPRVLPQNFAIGLSNSYRLRVLRGPEFDQITSSSLDLLFREQYIVSTELDRMGCRLDGVELNHKGAADIISAPVQFGTIQLPADGQPIILLADSQTTGGYTRIANVATIDLPILGQLRAGNKISFENIDIEPAQKLFREQNSHFI